MTEANFYKSFNFNFYKFNKYHLNDQTNSECPLHYFGCIINGKGKITTKHTVLTLGEGEIFYIPKGLKYRSEWFSTNNDETKFYSFGFKISPINKNFVLQKIDCSKKCFEIFKELYNEVPITSKGIGKLYYFFTQVSDDMIEAKNQNSNPTIAKAIEFLEQNPNLNISQLARLCSVSESNIYPLFKKTLNKTPNEIKQNIMCEKAKVLLITTDKSIQEISDSLGFSSTSYFRKVLRKYFDKTPKEIRKSAKNI
ncbi:MAG: helix-turn-helix transcriptional regulator [Ruminococcaceae bacterium]|nr:helix-turn-helix transcriptional regulator [Oscillospiraceae bacterium]